jgi:myo-inositol-1-phosphate synthase
MKNVEEILTYEIYENEDFFHLTIPVQNLKNPKFLLKDKDLYIFLYEYKKSYVIKNLPIDFLEFIKNNKVLLTEIQPQNNQKILITLGQ